MATMQLIGRPKRKRAGTGITLDAEFLFTGTSAELDTAMPTLGILPTTGMATNAAKVAWNKQMGVSNTNAEITASDADWLGGTGDNMMWTVRISVNDGDTSGGGGQTKTPDNLKNKVESSYSTKEIFLDPVWWGLRKADKDDTGLTPYKSQNQKISSITYEIDYYKTYKNIEGASCKFGDFIFKNSYPTIKIDKLYVNDSGVIVASSIEPSYGTVGSLTAGQFPYPADGSVNDTLSPYSGLDDTNIQCAGKKCKVIVYSVTFYRKGRMDSDFAAWYGINPADGFGTASPYAKKRIAPDDSSEHRWKALENRVESVFDTNQDEWMKITRSMEKAPCWDGTYWTWDINRSYHEEWVW